MGSPIKLKAPKLRLGQRFGKGLGSIFNYLSPSMQLPLLKIMKRIHPTYADVFVRDLARKFAWEKDLPPQLRDIGYGKTDKAARNLRSWVFDNTKHEAGEYPFNVKFGWPKLLQYTLREQDRKRPLNFSRFNEAYAKYMETDEYKFDMALQDQKLQKELTELADEKEGAKIIPFKKPEKYRGGLISLIS